MHSTHDARIDSLTGLPLRGECDDLPFGVLRSSVHSPWLLILAAYSSYVLLTFLNDLANANLQHVVALLFLAVLAVHAGPRLLLIPVSPLTVALFLAALGPLVAWIAGFADKPDITYTIKYFALLFVIWAAVSLDLPPLYRASERWWGMGALIAVMLLSLAPGLPENRFEGWFFKNPNNFALVATSLLFYVDHERDSHRFMIAVYGFVAAIILLSGTAGALLAYLAGLSIVFLRSKAGRLACLAGAFIVTFTLLVGLFSLNQAPDQTSTIGSVWSKLSLTREYYADLVAGEDFNFWEIGQQHGGADLTSGLWRLSHWRKMYIIYGESGWGAKLLGHGLGTSTLAVGKVPHNDYLRLWFEVGAIGLLTNLAIWGILLRRGGPAVHGPAIMMAVYAFTENNFDNFLVMSLFALLMASAQRDRMPFPNPVFPDGNAG